MSNIIDFINNGEIQDNPKYNPKTKKGALEPPYVVSNDREEGFSKGINELANTIRTGFTQYGDPDKYSKYGVTVNPINTEEELQRERAENQSALEQAGRAVTQAIVNEAILGTFLGVSNIIDAAIQPFTTEDNDYTNPVSTYIEGLQNDIRNRFEIYQKNPGDTFAIGDFGWWSNNAVSVFSTVSMLLPTLGVTKGIGLLGKIEAINKATNYTTKGMAKLARNTSKFISGKAPSIERLDKTIKLSSEIVGNAFVSRTIENYMEARGVWNEVKDNTLAKLQSMSGEELDELIERNPQFKDKSLDEIANYIAGESADKTFVNDYAMLLMDIAQFKAIGSLWKGVTKKTPTSKLRSENRKAIKNLVGKAEETATKNAKNSSWLNNRIELIKEGFRHPLTTVAGIEWIEGIEEGYQGVQTEKGKEVAEMILDPNYNPRTIGNYLSDSAIWEQAFWGVLGGVAFQKGGTALGNIYRKAEAKYKHKKGKISDEDFALNMTAEEKIRSEEIKGRAAINKKFVDSMKLLEDLKDPDEYKTDPITGKIIKEDGVELNKSLTPEEAEIKKAKLVNDYVSAITMSAIDAGNYDLLVDYISSPEFQQYFEETGLNLTIGDKQFNQQLLEKSKEIYNNYETALYNVLVNTEVENESVARIAAREITREQLYLEEIDERRQLLEDKINEINTSSTDVIDNYKRKALKDYVKKQLAQIDQMEQSMYEDYRNHNITEQAKNQYEKDYNNRRKSLINLLNNNLFSIEITKQIDNLFKNRGIDISFEINNILNDIETIIDSQEDGEITNATKEFIDKQIGLDDAYSYQEYILPKNQQDYIDRINEISQQVDRLTQDRLNNAAKKVEDYIIKQDNLEQAIEDIMSGKVEELKNELDILKIGYYSTDAYTKSIIATVREEQQKRKKREKEEKEAIVDGKKVSESKAETIKKDIETISDITENTETNSGDKESFPSTGDLTETNVDNENNSELSEEEKLLRTITPEDIEQFDEAAKKDAEKLAEAYNISVDEEAVGMASTITFDIFRTSRNLFDDALDKDISSPEVQRIISMVTEAIEEKGVSVGFAPAAARRGVRVALNTISRRLSSRKDSKAEKFKQLADSIATMQDMTKDMAAITRSIPESELDSIIDNFLEAYKEYKQISTPAGQKVIINLDKLFNDIIYNEEIGIDIDTALHILWNMKDYINNPINTKYVFTSRRDLTAILNNPSEFFNSITNAKLQEVQLDNYMHISPITKRTEEYERLIAGLTGNEDVEVEYLPDRNGNINSISFKVKGKEIGYISVVFPNKTNTGYKVFISPYSGGIAYNISKTENGYSSNTDELFDAILDQEDVLWSIIHKEHVYNINPGSRSISDEEINKFINHPAIKKALEDKVIILPKKYDERTKKVVDKYVTDRQKVKFIINKLENIVFYNPLAQLGIEYRESYNQWIENAFNNFKNTHRIQTALDTNKKIITKFAGLSSTYGIGDSSDVKTLIDEEEHGISEIGLTFDKNPIVGVINDQNNSVLVNEGTKKATSTFAPFKIGTMGMLIGGREDTPILALFTSSNKLQDGIKKQLKDEIIDIITGFQEKRYTYEEVDKKLSSLFNGPGINNPTIFQGYSVIHNGNSIALNIGGQLGKYVLVINKFKKDSNELGTGISYIPNGDINKASGSISVNKKFIEKIAEEIVNNVVYNRTFYTLDNIEKDNTSDNPYMYKEDGKFVIELGGIKTVYENFGDFVLRENAFNTTQGRNEYGGYFSNTDKINSLYVDVSVLEKPKSNLSPVEGEYQSIADTIKTATKEKFNSSKDLLKQATIPQDEIEFLSGTNAYGISLIPEEYGYDSKLTKEYAVFRNGKIFFGNAGASYANSSPFTLKRLLIHENLHDKINKQNLFDREGLVDDLFDTYYATIEAIDNIIKTASEDSAEYKNAVIVRQWIENNKFNPTEYFTKFTADKNAQYAEMTEEERRRIFAEEWLVETLTQPTLMNFLNNTRYDKEEVIVEGITNETKSIWQKIIDLLLKLFRKGSNNVKNNTIFAKQYLILGNINNNIDITETNRKAQDNIKDNAGEDINKNEENITEEIEQDTDIDETQEFDEDNPEAFNDEFNDTNDTNNKEDNDLLDIELNTDDERLSSTTSAEEYILDHVANDGNATAETFGVTRITNMADYLNMFSEQDKPIIAKMLQNGELKYACR